MSVTIAQLLFLLTEFIRQLQLTRKYLKVNFLEALCVAPSMIRLHCHIRLTFAGIWSETSASGAPDNGAGES